MPYAMASTRFRKTGRHGRAVALTVGVLTLLAVVLYWHEVTSRGASPQVTELPERFSTVRGSNEVDESLPEVAGQGSMRTVLEGVGADDPVAFSAVGDLPTVAQDLVACYEQTDSCLVRQAGYLDLFGEVWGCVFEGPGWVDLCVVRERECQSEVHVKRWYVAMWRDAYEDSNAG